MASQDKPNMSEDEYNARNENKYMWIAVGLIVVIMLGGMGINMLVHHETSAETVEMGTSQPSTPQQ
jgi:flagellar basal body-associated protein FliL